SKRPNARTRNLLHEWYRRRQAEQDTTAAPAHAVSEQEDGRPAEIALDLLASYFPESQRQQVRAALLGTMEHAFTKRGVQRPGWLTSKPRTGAVSG
ncbi:MAG: hypothetical protein LC667_20205, partial [Thioalkalivibrio sp.]|nr:hypothetical protein [Thioalkalivibrio sp.]